ncbi:MAG: RagB/SusD family nutrient uptake outer membrane protein [Bacteroidota bacterium]
MKITIKILTVLAILSLPACKKYLERNPHEFLSTGAFYKNEKDIELALYGSYASLREIKNSAEYVFNENRSDNATYQYRLYNDAWIYPSLMTVDPGNTHVDQYWRYSYVLISRVNLILKHIDVVADEAVRKRFTGEAKFLRAWAYFNLVRYFGDVPLVTEPFESGNLAKTKDRDPVANIYPFLIAELQDAMELLGATPVNLVNDYGRANKWAAGALLGKVLLTKGDKPAALTVLRNVYDNSGYQLVSNYAELFAETTETTQAQKEVFFAVRFSGGGMGTGSVLPTYAGIDIFHGFGRNVTLFSNSLLNAYVRTSDTAVDKRYKVTCNNIPAVTEGPAALGILKRYPAKGVGVAKDASGNYKSVLIPVQNDSGTDFPELRFADVVLMLAECEGNTTTGLTLLNRVRTRAGAPAYTAASITTLFNGDFQEAVLNERRLELAFEGDRLFDLKRMGDVYMEQKLLQFYTSEPTYTRTDYFPEIILITNQVTHNGTKIDAWRFLLPIPRNQIVRSDVMKQNPGYTN